MVLVAVGVAFQGGGNPTIQPGGTSSFPRTGYDNPSYALTWDIKNGSGVIVAQDDTPNGWNLDVVNDNLVVTAPSNAVIGTNYEVRFSGVMQEIGGAHIRTARTSKSKADQLKPRAWGGAPAKPGEKNLTNPIARTKAHPDDIIIIPVSKSAYFDVVSANVAPNAPSNLSATAVASNRINIAWTDNSTNEGGFKIYRLAPGGSWTNIATTASNVTSYSDIPLLPSTTYSYKVTAFNSYGESSASNTGTQTTFASTTLPAGYAGNDFYIIDPDNCSIAHTNHSGAKVRVTAPDGATGLLTLTATGDSTPFTIAAGSSTLLSLSDSHRLYQNDEVNNDSYRLTTDNAVTVEVLDYDQYVSESWAVLPNTILGTEYVTSNYVGSGGYMSQFAIVATTDNTVVTITPSVLCGANRTAHVPFAVTLNRGQAYQLKSTQWDLTGTQITSTQPIGLVSGAQGARVPVEYGYGNPLEEQLLPFNLWQTEYVGIPFAHHPHARFRLTAARNRTHISVYYGDTDTTSTYTLDAGQMQEIETTSPILVNADKPFQGMQLSNGESYDYNFNDPTTVGDPMMVSMPSTFSPNNLRSNWLTNAIIPVASDGFDYHYVTLISETHAMTTMYLNGNVINGWQGIGNTRFQYVRIPLSPGNNVINGIYQGGAVGVNLPAHFVAYTSQFTESDATGSIVGGLTYANDYVNVHPDNPTNLTAVPVSASAIDLAWTGDSNAYGYRIERKTDTTNWVQVHDNADAATTYHDTGLHHKTKYYYRVIAYADEDSNYSNTANATTLNEIPVAPTGLNAVAQDDSHIQLTWIDNSDNENNFVIQRSQGDNQHFADVKTADPNTTTWTDTNLTKKTIYYYRVKSVNEIGPSVWSNEAHDTTKDTKPNDPTGLVANALSYNHVHLTWNDNSNNEDYFRIERQNAQGGWDVIGTSPADTTQFDDYRVIGNSSYIYQVFAVNNGGDSLHPAGPATANTPAPPIPNAPSSVQAQGLSQTQMLVTWTDNSDCEDQFIIQRSPNGSTDWAEVGTTTANVTTFTDSSLAASTTYWYRVRAMNTTGYSTWSAPGNGTTLDDSAVVGPSGKPLVFYAVPSGATSNNLYWTPSSGSTSYNVYRRTSASGTPTLIGSKTPDFSNQRIQTFIDPSASTGTAYYYTVRAVNSLGESGDSDMDVASASSSAMPLNGSLSQIISWAEGHSIGGLELPAIGQGNALILMPDGTVVDTRDGSQSYDPNNARLQFSDNTGTSDGNFIFQQQGGNVRHEQGGGQFTLISSTDASYVNTTLDLPVASYFSPNFNNLPDPHYNANAGTKVNYVPNFAGTKYLINSHALTEAENIYVGFFSFNDVPIIGNTFDWATLRDNPQPNVEFGFGMNHFGDFPGFQFRYAPFVRSAMSSNADHRYYLELGAVFQARYAAEQGASIRADVGAWGLDLNEVNLNAQIFDDHWAIGEVRGNTGTVGRKLITVFHQPHIGPLPNPHNRAKLGFGLDQTYMGPRGNAAPPGNDWVAENTSNGIPLYFKRGHYMSGSTAALIIPEQGFSQTDPSTSLNGFGTWYMHRTNKCALTSLLGVAPLVTINNN